MQSALQDVEDISHHSQRLWREALTDEQKQQYEEVKAFYKKLAEVCHDDMAALREQIIKIKDGLAKKGNWRRLY